MLPRQGFIAGALAVLAGLGSAGHALAATVFWTDWRDATLQKVDIGRAPQETTTLFPIPEQGETGLSPMTLTLHGDRIWWTSNTYPAIFSQKLDGTDFQNEVSYRDHDVEGFPQYVVFDESHQRMFWTSNTKGAAPVAGGSVWTSDIHGIEQPRVIYRHSFDAKGLAIDEDGGWLYVGMVGELMRVKLTDDHLGIVPEQTGRLFNGFEFIAGVVNDPVTKRLYWSSPSAGSVWTALPTDPAPARLYQFDDRIEGDPDPGPIGLALDKSRTMLYWTRHVACDCVQRAPASGNAVPETVLTGTDRIFGIAIHEP
jgi:hypothetical protein